MSREHFRQDNTEGYTQEQLDFHNKEFEKFLINEKYDPESENGWDCLKSMSDKYFTDYMC